MLSDCVCFEAWSCLISVRTFGVKDLMHSSAIEPPNHFLLIVFGSQESLDLATPQSQDASHLLPPPCSSPLLASPVEEHSQTEGPSSEKMDAHLLKKMAFR